MEKAGIEHIDMPPCGAQYLAAYLFEIGPTLSSGMGDGPITHSEIAAWMGNTGIELDAWQARTLRRLSLDYLGESQAATQRGRPAPWQPEDFAVDKWVAQDSMKNALRDLANL